MDIVQSTRSCIEKWEVGGEADCRRILLSCNPADNDALSTIYHALLTSALATWSSTKRLSIQTLVDFIKSVLEQLPSSSSSSTKSPSAVAVGELLIDIIWTLEAELEDVLADSKTVRAECEQKAASSEGGVVDERVAASLEAAERTARNVEADQEILAHALRQLVVIGILDANACRVHLEKDTLQRAGLVEDGLAFNRKEVRWRTAIFYKQNKFNLLREQSEGYSKLTTELTSSLGSPHSPSTGQPLESRDVIDARARPTWERIVGLIGYFDLDPNRALDIILDVFSVNVATHYSFFLSLLSFSPWSAASRPKQNEESMQVEVDPDVYRGKTLDEVLKLAETQNGRIPPLPQVPAAMGANSSRVLAQVLGFKFAYYQSPEVSEQTPKNLCVAAALLIREGFISLEDLYPHLSPTDEGMTEQHSQYLASVDSRIAGAKISMLAMAAPLESSGSQAKARPSTPAEGKSPSETKEISNQKVGLLNALLSVGALRPSIAILSKYPWLVDAHPEIADLMLRILKHSVAGLYDTVANVSKPKASFLQPRAKYGSSGVTSPPERKPQLTVWAPTPPCTGLVDFVFFFPQWTERVPLCSKLEDIQDVLEPLMRFIGLHVSRDITFLTKFCRLGRHHLLQTVPVDPETRKPNGTPDPEHPIRQFWFHVIRLYLLTALPLIRGNAVCTVEIWQVIRQYEVTARWRLYGEWKAVTYKSHPELRVREVQADREAKGILRRLSHNTVDSLSGTVAKLAHSNPIIYFTNVVNQVMAYDNLAGVVIQALNYVTIMGFDVLVFIILDALANPHKDRVKDDGVNTTDWLQSLASFIGMLFRRYSTDLTPILQYIVHQLHQGQTSEIIVLRELIWKMAGIEPLPSLSDSQIIAMAGGPTLRIEAVASAQRGARSDPADLALKAPFRIGKCLIDSQLALPLLIQVAQQRQACVHQAANAHLKSLASLFDATHGVLLQYLELLTSPHVVKPDQYANQIIPSLLELNQTYGICAPICMQIIRPVLHNTLLSHALAMQEKERAANEEAEKRLKAALTAKREPSTAVASRVASPAVGADTTGESKPSVPETQSTEDVPMEGAEANQLTTASPPNPWVPELHAMFDDVRKIAPGNAGEIIGPTFYLTFWQLSTYDLSPPAQRYEEESNNLRVLSTQEDKKYITADRSNDRAKRVTADAHKQRRDRANQIVELLSNELKQQTASRSYTIKRLAKEKQHWFIHGPKAAALASAIVEHCLHPRALLSPMDADYCAQIIKVVHLQGTPCFSTIHTYDKVLGDHVKVVVFSCSEYEARNYGRFLLGILTDISKWYRDEQLFMQDNRVKSGGKVMYLPGFMRRFINKPKVLIEDILKWDDFRSMVRKWHRKILRCFIDCIETKEYMHVYNTIIVLKEILPVFPVASVHGDGGTMLHNAIEDFAEKEERGDLKILARAYSAGLKKREPMWAAPQKAALAKVATSTSTFRPSSVPPPAERSRAVPGSSTPNAPASSARGTPIPPPSTPSAPRSHTNGLPSAPAAAVSERPSSKFSVDNIPRPEVIKRVRTEPGQKSNGDIHATQNGKGDAMDVDRPAHLPTAPRRDENGTSRHIHSLPPSPRPASPTTPSGSNLPALPKDVHQLRDASRPNTPSPLSRSAIANERPQSPRPSNTELRSARTDAHAMPPPAAPSQTLSAHELRETAKATRPSDKNEDKLTKAYDDSVSRRRSPSPSSRPGTRNPSVDSRASGGRSRTATNETERSEEKRADREGHRESRDSVRRDSHSRRNEREKDSERERDRDRDRDRHGDRERPRERESRRERDRERDRDKEERDRDHNKEKERERDRERDRNRHRRDDRDRERDSRKERETSNRESSNRDASSRGPAAQTQPADEHGLPNRPDASRRRDGEETLGKRRRPTEDESDRASKRLSRKESHHERDKRSNDKDHDRNRDSDRRRKDRDQQESDPKSLSVDTKLSDKRIPEGPASARSFPSSVPSAPRAMKDDTRTQKTDSGSGRDRDWRRESSRASDNAGPGGGATSSAQDQGPQSSGGSLRDRLDLPRNPPQGPSRDRNEPAPADRHRSDNARADDNRDSGRKRSSAERDNGESAPGSGDQGSAPPKRVKINRSRYPGGPVHSGLAKKVLPIDAEKTRASGRKD